MTLAELNALNEAHRIIWEAASDGWVDTSNLCRIADHLLEGGTVVVKDGEWITTVELPPKPDSR